MAAAVGSFFPSSFNSYVVTMLQSVAFHPSSQFFFTGSADHVVRMWKVMHLPPGAARTGVPDIGERSYHGHASGITALAPAPCGSLLASAGEGCST